MNSVIASERIPIKVWVDPSENKWWYDGALEQAKNLANLPFAYKWISIMPDSHVGYGMPIGAIMATQGVVVPNAVGVDIGCGMVACKSNVTEITTHDLQEIMKALREVIPVGFNHQDEPQSWDGFNAAPDIPIIQKELGSAKNQLGTLGGGNHFVELQKDEDGYVWIMIHSGSRNFGYKTAKVYHEVAKKMCEKWQSDLPHKDLSFLPMDTQYGKDYLAAMNYALSFAEANRALMMKRAKRAFCEQMSYDTRFIRDTDIIHNFAATENHYGKNVLVHRKGATKASIDTIGIIPGSMGTSSYIVQGLGNKESFESCSHGAGRTMGRGQAKRDLDLKVEQGKMADVVGGPRSTSDLDEAPGSYKDIDVVMENQLDLVDVLVKLTPIANMKG